MEFLVSAGQLLTGPDGDRTPDGAVLVRGDRIVAAGPRAEVEARASASAVRLARPEGTLLPGLIDTHVHLCFDAGPDPVTSLRETDDTALLLAMADRARRMVATGVTTVRDLGDRGGLALRLRDAVASGAVSGPRVLAAGAPLTVPGGHCWFLGGEVSGEEAIRETVRRNAKDGADVIKVMATGGGLTKGGPAIWEAQFSPEELRAVVEEARAHGLPVAAHAHGADGIAAAVAAGVDTVEHCTWMGRGGFDVREDVVADIAARGIAVCPAASPGWRAFAERFGPERAEEMFARVRWMHEQGVRLISGTDAGVPGAVFDDLVSSLGFFVHLGLPPSRVVAMATADAAAAVGLGDETGRLADGYRADLLLVDGDPLADLEALREVRAVLAGGRLVTGG
ncbi:amidohydrolase family protein [Streptomyces sp. DSM 42041]|uniref:Amidohydrolase family protein n=1 Tax=Streptomyces hazeniae TaxID=3075538 RepID=A0ABU2NVI6_9ACTN|nr:amidohydrolase family protein [Streptomyces sp. DSM 42041]MDT0380012.1 amidohydrolase family protein [Streptomyces sp. DSM 42041]